jgi:hypothetical protein
MVVFVQQLRDARCACDAPDWAPTIFDANPRDGRAAELLPATEQDFGAASTPSWRLTTLRRSGQ